MFLQGYFDVFPQKRTTELRTATLMNGDDDDVLPDGTYVFTEYFCTDLSCNCERVLVKVIYARSEDAVPNEVATISYSWNPNSDETWRRLNSEMPNPFLDPAHRQTRYASQVLEFWTEMIKRDKAYASRLERHYEEIRAEVGGPGERWDGSHMSTQKGQKSPFRRLTKQERAARKRLLERVRKRK